MKAILTTLTILIYAIAINAQCSAVSIQVSSSSQTSVQLYHAGFFLIPAGFDNVIDWEVLEFDGTLVHEETTLGAWAEQSFSLFNHTVPTTDSMAVMITIVNNTSGITCVINDTLAWEGQIIGWAPISNNTGVESAVLGLDVVTGSSVSCFGGHDGTIEVVGLNGMPPYSFSIDGGPFVPDPLFIGLIAGDHTIVITDQANGMASITLSLSEPDELQLEVSTSNITCYGGNEGGIVSNASGGFFGLGYKYFIDGIGPFESGIFNNLSAGLYIIRVEDGNDCIKEEVIEIFEPAELLVDSINVSAIACASSSTGEIDFDVIGGTGSYTFIINNQDTYTTLPISDLLEGQYTMTVQDESLCSSSFNFEITALDTLTLQLDSIINADCKSENNGSITITASGGTQNYNYTLGTKTNTTGIFDSLPAGNYEVMVLDSFGCTIDTSFIIEVDTLINASYDIKDVFCSGDTSGRIMVSIEEGNEGFTFYLNNEEMPTSTFNNLSTGDYEIVIAGANGCLLVDTIALVAYSSLKIDSISTQNVNCSSGIDGMIMVLTSGGSGGLAFTLDSVTNTSGLFDGIAPGNYTVFVTDSLGCIDQKEVIIQEEGQISVEITMKSDISCYGSNDGMVTLIGDTIGGQYQYQLDSLSNETGIFEGLAPGTYLVTVSNAQNCFTEIEFEIQDVPPLEIELVEFIGDDGTSNGSITVSSRGGITPYQYSIDNGTTYQTDPTFPGLVNDSYIIIVKDANGCLEELMIVITDVKYITLNQNLRIYPNPSALGNDINILSDLNINHVSIYNANGQVVSQRNYQSNQVKINTNQLLKGIYLFSIHTSQGITWKKLIITE